MPDYQTTISSSFQLKGIGVHSGQASIIEVRPAPADHGIVFIRPLPDGRKIRLPATIHHAMPSDLCTTLEVGEARVETIEHLMAAIRACQLDNLEIEVPHHEVPIMDGSAHSFIQAFAQQPLIQQEAKRRYLRITKPLRLENGEAWAEFLPSDQDDSHSYFDISIDFACPLIGQQRIDFELNFDFFAQEIAPARTFGFLEQAKMLRARGLAQGASPENCLVIGEDNKLHKSQTLRFEDEFVRHKALDAIGDSALLGLAFMGRFRAHRPSHRLNGEIVKQLLASPSHFEITTI